jgi:hypothetical protein
MPPVFAFTLEALWDSPHHNNQEATSHGLALDAAHLTILGPRLFGPRLEDEREIIIPVPASERPALETFLAEAVGRRATIPSPRV